MEGQKTKSGIRIIKHLINERPDFLLGPPVGCDGSIEIQKANDTWSKPLIIVRDRHRTTMLHGIPYSYNDPVRVDQIKYPWDVLTRENVIVWTLSQMPPPNPDN